MFHLFTGYVFHFAQPIIANSAKPMLPRESGCVLHVVVLFTCGKYYVPRSVRKAIRCVNQAAKPERNKTVTLPVHVDPSFLI